MAFVIAGLGNTGEEYTDSRHNAGRMAALYYWEKRDDFSDWKRDKKSSSDIAKAPGGKSAATLVIYDGFMNNSGKALSPLVKSLKQAEQTIVIYDDIDLPLGSFRISFDRGDGGHNGVKSVIKHLKTKKFLRVRIGVAQTTPTGKLKKPKDEEKFRKFLLSEFKSGEKRTLKKVFKEVAEVLDCLRNEKREKCMSLHN